MVTIIFTQKYCSAVSKKGIPCSLFKLKSKRVQIERILPERLPIYRKLPTIRFVYILPFLPETGFSFVACQNYSL